MSRRRKISQTLSIRCKSCAIPYGQSDMDRHSIGKGHSNRLPFHTDIVQRPDGTSTIGDPPMCLRTPSFTAHSRHANPIHCQCSDKPLPIQYQSNVNLMSILCQFNLQSHNDPCRSIANLIPIHANHIPIDCQADFNHYQHPDSM